MTTRTIVRIGSYAAFVVNIKDVSPLLGILERATPVDRRWSNSGSRWVLTDGSSEAVEIVMDRSGLPLMAKAEWDALRERERAEEEAAKAAEEAAA